MTLVARRWSILRSLQGRSDRLRNAELGVVLRPQPETEWLVPAIAWQALQYEANWASYGGGYAGARYLRHPETGQVLFEGMVYAFGQPGVQQNAVIGYVAVGSRPAYPTYMACPMASVSYIGGPYNLTLARVEVHPNGSVIYRQGPANTTTPLQIVWLSLTGSTYVVI